MRFLAILFSMLFLFVVVFDHKGLGVYFESIEENEKL